MDNRERIELMVRIRNLKGLLKDMIEMEEYELCGKIRDIIWRKEKELIKLDRNSNNSEYE